jgi:hypothetical protein
VPGAALHPTPGSLTCGHAGLEKLIGYCAVKDDRFTIAPLDQTNECCAGAMEDLLRLAPFCIRSRPSDMRARRARLMGWLCGSLLFYDRATRPNECIRAGAMELFY